MTPRDPSDLALLASQTLWVRRLALAIARDAHAADDLAQDAWLAALRRSPDADEGLGAWFSAVLRNLARFRVRSEARRSSREQVAARPERQDDPVLALERLETQEELLRAVRQLAEPYRSTVILRWFEGLEPAEIALRGGVPVRTVHTRLTRALVQLREHLGRRDQGGRAGWMSAWLPLLPKTAGTLPWIFAMQLKTKLGLAAAAAAALASAWLLFDSRPATPLAAPAVVASSGAALASPEASSDAPLAPTVDERARVDVPSSGAEAAPAAAAVVETPPPADIEGLVVDVNGAPVRGLEVCFRSAVAKPTDALYHSELATAVTDANGRFRLPPRRSAGRIAPSSDVWVEVLEPVVRGSVVRGSDGLHILVVAPRIDLAGRVVDPLAQPIAGAELRVVLPDIRARLELILDASVAREWSTESREHGEFLLGEAPVIEGARLHTRALGYEPDFRDLPLATTTDLEIALRPLREASSHVVGRVVDANGLPVSAARVALGARAVLSDESGRFQLDLDQHGEGLVLRALKEGFLPAELACATPSPRDVGAWPDPLALVIDRTALSISGRVLDASRAAVARARVEVLDTTPFAGIETTFGSLHVVAGEHVEPLLAGREFAYAFETDAEGRFEARGLLARAYRLLVFDHQTMAVLVTDPIEAGTTGVDLLLPASERHARIAGRVVDQRGAPIAGASVRPMVAEEHGALSRYHNLFGEIVRTDAAGSFEFLELSRTADRLTVSAPLAPGQTEIVLADAKDLAAIEVVVSLLCHMQVDLTESNSDATAFAVLDGTGRALSLVAYHGDGSYSTTLCFLADRRSQALAVSEDARTLVLYRGADEVARHPLQLLPGELNVVRP